MILSLTDLFPCFLGRRYNNGPIVEVDFNGKIPSFNTSFSAKLRKWKTVIIRDRMFKVRGLGLDLTLMAALVEVIS